MRRKLFCSMIPVLVLSLSSLGQGTFQYDQETSTQDVLDANSGGIDFSRQPLGQSFAPSLNSVGFIRLYLSAAGISGGSGTFDVNMRSDSIAGPILGTSSSVTLGANAFGFVDFFFNAPIAVTPGTTYFFQPEQTSGSGRSIFGATSYNYFGGTGFVDGAATPQFDLWFREGVVVPEPSAAWILVVTGACFFLARGFVLKRPRYHSL